jgi:DNA repair exonuclease SbcCD ATPase subunit
MEVFKVKKLFILLILLAFAIPANAATVYKWVDKEGVVSFTDNYNDIPSSYRNRVEVKHYLTEGLAPAYTDVAPQKKAEAKADLHERDYWNKQLDEAISNYEKVREELLKEGERLVWHRYGGKTQYQMFTAEFPSMSERLETYREQIDEAKAMLDEFTTETQETEGAHGKRASVINGESKTDLYGRDETWWREKVQPWKEQLEEATENYEKTQEEFVKQGEALGPFRWGRLSLTQYQMISSRLTELSERMGKYQSQIAEARSMLSKLSKEAKETKADPIWLE